MIVGPFLEPFLEAAIESCIEICNEFVVIDTSPENNPNRKVLDKWARRITYPSFRIIDMPREEIFDYGKARELARVNSEDGWIMRLDADEVVHEKDVESILETVNETDRDIVSMDFFHFMVHPDFHQPNQGPKPMFFKKNLFSWRGNIHEILEYSREQEDHILPEVARFYHYGYCRGPEEVFKRWKLYADIGRKPAWWDGYNPKYILDDRIAFCDEFTGTHPKYVIPQLIAMGFYDYTINVLKIKDIWIGAGGKESDEILFTDKETITIARKN